MTDSNMSMKMWQFLLRALILSTFSDVSLIQAKFYQECIGADKENKFVASRESCAKYIYCDGNNSFEGECLDDNIFNEIQGQCDKPTAVVCKIGAPKPNVDGGRQDGTNILNFGSGNSNSNNLNAMQSQWNGLQQTTGTASQSLMELGGTVAAATANAPKCPLTFGLSNVIYLPSTESCAAYYTCYNGIALPMICPRNTYFNEETARCERKEHVYCPLDRPVRMICNKGVYDYIPHPRNCGYYYLCSNGYLMIFHCPFQYTWHYERRTCVHPSQSKCFSVSIAQSILQ